MSDDLLSDAELLRYHRQINLLGGDIDGQERLKKARLLIIGVGGLGCAAAQYLALAGVGRLTLVDHDAVEASNLQRQVLHRDSRIGQSKVSSAAVAKFLDIPGSFAVHLYNNKHEITWFSLETP